MVNSMIYELPVAAILICVGGEPIVFWPSTGGGLRFTAAPLRLIVEFPFEAKCFFQFVVRKIIGQLFAIEDTCGMKGTHCNRFIRRLICLAVH